MRALIALATVALCGCATASSRSSSSPRAAAGSAQGSAYAQVGGLRMYYEDRGQGRPLVLLHGGGSTAQTSFGAIMPELAKAHRVIAPEQQGHGHTADLDRPFSFEQMADDTAALLDQLGVGEADVLGFSNGGVVALELALRHPQHVRRLLLASTYFEKGGLPADLWKSFDHASPENMPRALREAYQAVAPHPEALRSMVTKTIAMMRAFQDLPESALRSLHGPALVMLGDADIVTPAYAARMAKLIPGGQLAVFPGSGHGTFLGAAEATPAGSPLPQLGVATIEAFLAGP